jgi:hypothetical protein
LTTSHSQQWWAQPTLHLKTEREVRSGANGHSSRESAMLIAISTTKHEDGLFSKQ